MASYRDEKHRQAVINWQRKKRLIPEYRRIKNEQLKKWQQTFFGTMALKASSINTTSGMRGGIGKIKYRDLLILWEEQGGKYSGNKCVKWAACAACGKRMNPERGKNGYNVDHIVRIADGGKNIRNNLQFLCTQCHRKKTANERAIYSTGEWGGDKNLEYDNKQLELFQ